LLFHPKLKGRLGQRLGFYPKAHFQKCAHKPTVWLHGASAGDVLALHPLAVQLKKSAPNCALVISAMTNSGLQMAEQRIPEADAIIAVPFDLIGATTRAVRCIAPRILLLEYSEIWPNLIDAAWKADRKVVLHNGRFSPERLHRQKIWLRIIGNPLHKLHLLLVRNADEAKRAAFLEIPKQKIQITGNTKFDALLSQETPQGVALHQQFCLPTNVPIFVAGSTHQGEEELLVQAFLLLKKTFPKLIFVVVPRYEHRSPKVLSLFRKAGFRSCLRSDGQQTENPDVMVVDTTGELRELYPLASLVFVGGSLVPVGGHNILEPAQAGSPTLFGPYMNNVLDCVAVLRDHGGIQIHNVEQLVRQAATLLENEDLRKELGQKAKDAAATCRGAAKRNAQALLGELKEAS